MSEETKREAAEHVGRARRQAAHAAKNGAKAVKAVAEPVVEEIHDEAHKAEGTVKDALREVAAGDPKRAIALLAVGLGGVYLLGQVLGYRQGKRMTAKPPIDVDYTQVD